MFNAASLCVCCKIPPFFGRPLPLETTASEEMTIIDNMALFEKNGFRFTVRTLRQQENNIDDAITDDDEVLAGGGTQKNRMKWTGLEQNRFLEFSFFL